VYQLIPTTEDLSTRSLNFPDSEHVANEQEVEGKEMQSLLIHLTCKEAFVVLSVFDCGISSSDANQKDVKAMDKIHDCV
jgi:hypothetical protein